MLLPTVLINFPNSQVCLIGEWSIASRHHHSIFYACGEFAVIAQHWKVQLSWLERCTGIVKGLRAHTHRTRCGNAARFSAFQKTTNSLFKKIIKNFIIIQLLDSSILFIFIEAFYCRPIHFLSKNEKSRRVAESRPVCVGPYMVYRTDLPLTFQKPDNIKFYRTIWPKNL